VILPLLFSTFVDSLTTAAKGGKMRWLRLYRILVQKLAKRLPEQLFRFHCGCRINVFFISFSPPILVLNRHIANFERPHPPNKPQ